MNVIARTKIEELIQLDDDVINIVEQAFRDLSEKQVTTPPIMRMDIPEHNGEVDIKSAYVSGYDSFAIKISSGFFNNYKLGLPSANGLILLISAKTGEPKAVLADNGYLTDIRTAAAGAVAASHLAKVHVRKVGVIGTGAQARYQIKALAKVRKFEKIVVYGRTRAHADQYKKDMEADLHIPVEVKESPKNVVEQSDVVVTTTPSTEPIIEKEWFHPGLHITAMGSDAEHKQELGEGVLEVADVTVCDVLQQSLRLGELRPYKSGSLEQKMVELGDVITGKVPGRQSDDQVTVCDLTGTGIQDTAIARYTYELYRLPSNQYENYSFPE